MLGAIAKIGTYTQGLVPVDEGVHLCLRHAYFVLMSDPVANMVAVNKERDYVILVTAPIMLIGACPSIDFSDALQVSLRPVDLLHALSYCYMTIVV